jgi:hypothetical protein
MIIGEITSEKNGEVRRGTKKVEEKRLIFFERTEVIGNMLVKHIVPCVFYKSIK